MTAISLETLGFTKEELADRVVTKLADQLLATYFPDTDSETGDEFENSRPTRFATMIEKAVKDRINKAVEEVADAHLKAATPDFVGSVTFEQTNGYGEKKGPPITFREYLIHRAETYMTEKVDYDGKAKGDSWGLWEGKQTRVTHMVNKHLHYEIESAMKAALGNANAQIVGGLQETVKIQLQRIAEQLKVKVETK